MNAKSTGKKLEHVTKNGTDLGRLKQLTDAEIERAVENDPDAVLLEDFDWQEAHVLMPNQKGELVVVEKHSNDKIKE